MTSDNTDKESKNANIRNYAAKFQTLDSGKYPLNVYENLVKVFVEQTSSWEEGVPYDVLDNANNIDEFYSLAQTLGQEIVEEKNYYSKFLHQEKPFNEIPGTKEFIQFAHALDDEDLGQFTSLIGDEPDDFRLISERAGREDILDMASSIDGPVADELATRLIQLYYDNNGVFTEPERGEDINIEPRKTPLSRNDSGIEEDISEINTQIFDATRKRFGENIAIDEEALKDAEPRRKWVVPKEAEKERLIKAISKAKVVENQPRRKWVVPKEAEKERLIKVTRQKWKDSPKVEGILGEDGNLHSIENQPKVRMTRAQILRHKANIEKRKAQEAKEEAHQQKLVVGKRKKGKGPKKQGVVGITETLQKQAREIVENATTPEAQGKTGKNATKSAAQSQRESDARLSKPKVVKKKSSTTKNPPWRP